VELIDIYPTVLDWAGITVPDAVQGTSIRPPHDRDGRYAFSGDGVIRNASWKFMRSGSSPPDGPALYDLSVPPDEREDLQERYPGIAGGLRDRLADWKQRNQVLRSQLADLDAER